MARISTQEFERLPLRVHSLMEGVPLHDVWAVDLLRWRGEVTLDKFLQAANKYAHDICGCSNLSALFTPSPLVRVLLDIRFFVGRIFGWDNEPPTIVTFTSRLTNADRLRSLIAPSTRDGYFHVVYRFENEELVELINRTAHAAALIALVETPTAYQFYFAVYVRSVSRFTPFYMTVIAPFRKLIVYPHLLRSVRARWNQAFGTS